MITEAVAAPTSPSSEANARPHGGLDSERLKQIKRDETADQSDSPLRGRQREVQRRIDRAKAIEDEDGLH